MRIALYNIYPGNIKGKSHSANTGINGRAMLLSTSRKWYRSVCRLESIASPGTRYTIHKNEQLVFIKGAKLPT
jgi:hypothetical protein